MRAQLHNVDLAAVWDLHGSHEGPNKCNAHKFGILIFFFMNNHEMPLPNAVDCRTIVCYANDLISYTELTMSMYLNKHLWYYFRSSLIEWID